MKIDQLETPTVLFLCTGNSCRSQMAEGWARHYWFEQYNFFSAGIEKHGLNQRAVTAMKESGIDISSHHSQSLNDFPGVTFDVVITVCGHADEHCPVFSSATSIVHRGFDDPPKLAVNAETEEQAMVHYRRVRDEIHSFILALPGTISKVLF